MYWHIIFQVAWGIEKTLKDMELHNPIFVFISSIYTQGFT